MTHFDPKALTLLVISAASGAIQDAESLLVLAGVQSMSAYRPSKRRVETQGSEEHEGSPRENRQHDVLMWDVLLNACTPSYCEPKSDGDFQSGKMYRSSPMSQMSSLESYRDDDFDVTRENKDGFLRRAREVCSADSCDTSPRDGPV